MGEKRQLADQEEAWSSAKRQKSVGSKHSKHKPAVAKNTARPDSSGWVKKRIRAIERRLHHGVDTLPADVQIGLERELAALKRQIESRQEHRQRARMISKYHMVRFFERQKAMRLEKQLRRRRETTTDEAERAQLEADLHIAKTDQLYAIYFPFMEPYVSLYPAQETKKAKSAAAQADTAEEAEAAAAKERRSTAAQALHAPRPPMWTVVETTMRKGGLEALERLQNRQPARGKAGEDEGGSDEDAGKADKGKAGKDRKADKRRAKEATAKEVSAEEDSDDGGFFE